jgi:acetyl esterase/lipase
LKEQHGLSAFTALFAPASGFRWIMYFFDKSAGDFMSEKKLLNLGLTAILAFVTAGCTTRADSVSGVLSQGNGTANGTSSNEHITVNDSVSAIVNHSAFEGFGSYLMPWDSRDRNYNIPITQIASLMPYHNYIWPQVVVDSVNYMIDEVSEGKTIFYDFYTRQDKNADPAKNNAGLFFFRGNHNAPFVLLVPGGGFSYVGSLHEGFPLAVEIAQKGYNAFVLKYRPSRTDIVEDTAAALRYIFDNAESLGVNTDDYSLWGLSAGGESVAAISLETVKYGGVTLPKPGAAVFIYAWQRYFFQNDPAVFSAIGEDDRIGNVPALEEAVAASRTAGADIEYHRFPDTGHGFGLGTGTNAEGWLDMAVQFWERHITTVQLKNQ